MKRYWLALGLTAAGCFGPAETVLFDEDGSLPATGGSAATSGASFGAQAGTDAGQYVSGAPGAGTGANAGSASLGGSGGVGSVGGSGGSAGVGGNGGSGGDVPVAPVESCDMVEGSVVSPLNGHCYRVNESELTFAEARDACARAAGHLVTISSSEENDFTRELREGEHWLGAHDQLADDVQGVGTYVWVNDEPWEYAKWKGGQPNAFETDCSKDVDGGGCYEHCAFQADDGEWNDRSCWHIIASICEWDIATPGGEGGAGAGAGGEGGAAEPAPNRPNGPKK